MSQQTETPNKQVDTLYHYGSLWGRLAFISCRDDSSCKLDLTSYAPRREENRRFSALFKSDCFTLLGWEREFNLIEEKVMIFG